MQFKNLHVIYAGMAGKFAKEVGARQLIMTHFSQRYKSSQDVTEEVRVASSISLVKTQYSNTG